MRTKKVKIPIYYGSLIIIVSDDYKEVAKKYRITENVDLYGAFVWKQYKNDIAEFLICIDEKITNHLIAHECTHLVNYIFKEKGIYLDLDNDEPQAYLMGWLFKEIEDFLHN